MAAYGVNTAAPISSVPHDARPQQASTPKPPRPKAPAAVKQPTDPFAPLTPEQIRQTVAKYTSGYGTPQTPAQIQASAQGMLDPIIAAITANIGKQTSAASENIRGNAASLASSLAGIDYGQPYAGAEGKQAAIDAALQQSLTGGGQALASGLESRLAGIGGGSVQSAGSGLASRAAAIGTNEQAAGSGALSELVANEAAARSYGQKLPGIAQMQGLQGISGVEAAGVKQVGDQTAQVMGQLPQIVENLRSAAQNLSGAKAQAAAQLYEQLTGQNITKATASAGLRGAQAKLQQTTAYDNTRAGIAQQNANTAAARQQAAAQKGKQPKPLSASDKNRLNTLAHTLYNGVAQHVHFVSTGPGAGKWVPVPGTGQPPASWSQAVAQLVQAGDSVATAIARLNAQGWKPGEGGRPWAGKVAPGGKIGGRPMTAAEINAQTATHRGH